MNLFKTLAAVFAGISLLASCSDSKPSPEAASDNTQAVINNIMTRTSVRQFTSQTIGKDTLETIVKAGMAAPTAVNAQPWAFIVVTEREMLDSIANVHPWSNLKTAAAAIVVCGDMEKKLEGMAGDYWIQDCSAASENILLAAHAYGLGAVWCGVYPNPEILPGVKRVLGIPSTITPLSVITLGHPAQSSEPKDKWKPENVHYQRW
ncbi:MAG: nitroreductase family protein [Muribaculaceae bacterium]|nr:nitroreductase family protein [Muribaculaceae bacterium]